MERLGLAYLDLYLIHWPANKKQFGDEASRPAPSPFRISHRCHADVFDFELTAEEMETIDGLKDLGGQCALPDEVDF